MTFKYRYRKQIIIGVFCFILVVSIISISIINFTKREKKEEKKEEKTVLLAKKTKTARKNNNKLSECKVDIKGEINMPGIYTMKIDDRVIDVIELAGGLTENANTSVINLSKKVSDEMVIVIYSNEQVKDFERTKEIEKVVQDKCNQPDENAIKNDACIASDGKNTSLDTDKNNGKISINTASKEELMTLPGIGESKAKDIISYRETNGSFENIEDITKVSGIGESTFAQIKENITV